MVCARSAGTGGSRVGSGVFSSHYTPGLHDIIMQAGLPVVQGFEPEPMAPVPLPLLRRLAGAGPVT